jgi:hypothetical protein
MGIKDDLEKLHEQNEEREKRLRRDEDGRGSRPESVVGPKTDEKTGRQYFSYDLKDLNLEEAQNERDDEANEPLSIPEDEE